MSESDASPGRDQCPDSALPHAVGERPAPRCIRQKDARFGRFLTASLAGASDQPTGLTHLKFSFAGGGAAQVLRVRGKAEALFPEGAERVAGVERSDTPGTRSHKQPTPQRGGSGFVGRVVSGTPCRGAVPGGAAFRRYRFAQPSATFWDASGIGSSPAAGSSGFLMREPWTSRSPRLTVLRTMG